MENLTASQITRFENAMYYKYKNATRNFSNPGSTLYQKTLLEYIAEKNIGISLYQADDNLTSWSKKSLSTNGNQVTSQNCTE